MKLYGKLDGEARQIHGDKYDYSKVEYFNNTTKVEIICPEHRSFKQTPYIILIADVVAQNVICLTGKNF